MTDTELRIYDAVTDRIDVLTYRNRWLEFFFGKKYGWFEFTLCLPGVELPAVREPYRLEVMNIDLSERGIGTSIRRVLKLVGGQKQLTTISLHTIEKFQPLPAAVDYVYYANCKFHVPKF